MPSRWASCATCRSPSRTTRRSPSWVPDIPVSDDPDAWHPLDALFAPLYSISGTLVGVLSVDLPASGRRPDDVQRALLEMFATQAGIAIDNARLMSRVRASEESFRIAFENAPIGMSLVDFSADNAGRFLRVNEAMCRMIGPLPPATSRAAASATSRTRPTGPTDAEVVRRVISRRDRALPAREALPAADGHQSGSRCRPRWSATATGTALYGISQFEDIGDRRAEHQELTRRARIDPLTGLLNRSALTEQVRGTRSPPLAVPTARRRAVLRPRRLQAGQRHPRPRRRRPGAGDHRAAGSRPRSAPATPPPGSAATSSSWSPTTSATRCSTWSSGSSWRCRRRSTSAVSR